MHAIEHNTKQLWENALVDIELNISKANFSTWFKDANIARYEDGIVYLSVPNEFVRDWLCNKYHTLILKTLRGMLEGVRGVEYTIKKQEKRETAVAEMPRATEINGALPLQNHYINKEDNLNPRYTFETFVVGPFNELANAAAQAVVVNPGITYNPLFIFGGTGHGKTHLIQAIGNHIKKVSEGKKVHYVTSEKFATDYVSALQNNKTQAFKDKYRKHDVFIMDDVQFLSGKEKTQEELFHVFNTLQNDNKQIIFSSDKHPSYIPNIEDRLKSRFGAGMIVDIPKPDKESRIAILEKKIMQSKFILDDNVIDFLAEAIDGNIRDLEGILNSIICKTQLKQKTLNINEIKQLVKDNARPKRPVSTKDVVKTIAEFFEIDEDSIYEKTRRKEIVKPRQLIMYILREDFHISYPSIGDRLGGRDHTTVIHSCEKIKRDLQNNSDLSEEIRQIRALL